MSVVATRRCYKVTRLNGESGSIRLELSTYGTNSNERQWCAPKHQAVLTPAVFKLVRKGSHKGAKIGGTEADFNEEVSPSFTFPTGQNVPRRRRLIESPISFLLISHQTWRRSATLESGAQRPCPGSKRKWRWRKRKNGEWHFGELSSCSC